MAFTIPLTGLAANDPVPGNYLEINFAQGAASLGTATYPILLLGNRLSTGDATVDTVVYGPNQTSPLPLSIMQDWINRFGQGSELHRGARRLLNVNKVTPVFAVAVAESAGVQATLAITIAGPATAAGFVRTYIGDDAVDASFASGDSATTIALAIQTAVNAKLDWAVTMTPAAGVMTFTSKQKGLRGNWLRGSAVVFGTSTGVTSNVTTSTLFTGGTVSDNNTNALAAIAPFRYYYIVSAADGSSTADPSSTTQGLKSLQATVDTQALPITGNRQRVVAASVDPSSVAAVALVTTLALNSSRCEYVWQQSSDWTPFELASYMAGVYALEEVPAQFRCNFSGYGTSPDTATKWQVPACRAGVAPTRNTIKLALNTGLTPIATSSSGATYLVKRITTRFQTGGLNDYRIRDSHKVTICDRFGDDWLSICAQQLSGKKIANDPVKGQRAPGNDVVTPRIIKPLLQKLEEDYNDLGLLQNIDDIMAQTQVIRETSPTTRVSCKIPLQTVDILDQIATSLDQTA